MNSVEDKVDTYQIDTYNTTNTINLFLKGSNTEMSEYVLQMYGIEQQKAKRFSKSQILQCLALSGSLWLRQPVEDLRFDLGISFYGFTRCSWTIPTYGKVRLSFGRL